MLFFLLISLISAPVSFVKTDPKIEIYLNSSTEFRAVMMNPFNPVSYKEADFAPVTVRLKSNDYFSKLLKNQSSHFHVLKRNGKYMRIGRIVMAHTDLEGLKILKSLDYVVRTELDTPPHSPSPLDVTSKLISAVETWATYDSQYLNVTGKGMVIADIDSGLDLFQPAFFKADGGYYDWFDVNGDGKLTPGTDIVDINQNGQQDESDPVISYIDDKIYPIYGDAPVAQPFGFGPDEYTPRRDVLYIDTNGNGKRDNDAELGSTSDSDALGEPFFLGDDVNGNGILDVGEKIIRLKTSKVKAIYQGGVTRTRGVDLRKVPLDEYDMHGTGVCGILVGGNLGLTEYTGIAPDAELLFAQDTEVPLTQLFDWAIQNGADVILHEYAPWTGQFLDGSSNAEVAMNEAANQGIAQANPAGNLGGSRKGYKSVLNPGESKDVDINMPSYLSSPYIQITFLWRNSDVVPSFVLNGPSGQFTIDMNTPVSEYTAVSGMTDTYYTLVHDISPAGTYMVDLILVGWNGANYTSLPAGTYTVSIQHPGTDQASVELIGFVMDSLSGWGEGFAWESDVTEEHLIGHPATADSAITVAAYTGRDEQALDMYGNAQGELRSYSGRGHRIDGVDIMDIAAPANPVSTTCGLCTPEVESYGHYRVFGGTSGAGPHVAAAAALIKQVYPEATGFEIKDKIRAGALVDSDVTTPGNLPQSDMWGAGKLRIYEAAYSDVPPVVHIPSISTDATGFIRHYSMGCETEYDYYDGNIIAEDDVSSEENLTLRFDGDYDGVWDIQTTLSGYRASGKLDTEDFGFVVPLPLDGETIYMKVQIENEDGFTNEILIPVTGKLEICDNQETGDSSDTDGGSDGGCSCRTDSDNEPANVALFALFFTLFVLLKAGFRRYVYGRK